MLNVHLRIANAVTGRPTPVRVRVTAPDGTQFPPLGHDGTFPAGRNDDVGGHLWIGREKWWYVDGTCEMPLPAGVPLHVQIAKGPEWTPLDETVVLGAGQISLRFAVSRWADSRAEGWAAVDTRCHFISPHAALLEARAEDLDVVNLLAVPFPVLALDSHTYTTVPNLLAFSGPVSALERDGCSVVVNTLNAHPVLGTVALLNSHRPVFPLTFGAPETDDWGVCDWCDQCHRKKGLTVWVGAFEPAGGLQGGEALVAALLGKIDAIEVTGDVRKTPLLPWVYKLWSAGFRVPLVGASGKDSNRTVLGSTRTYVRADGGSWVEAVRSGWTVATAGPLLTLTSDGEWFRAAARAPGTAPTVELVLNGKVIAAGEGLAEGAVREPGWVAARCPSQTGFAHTSPVSVGAPRCVPDAAGALRKLVEQTREWAETHGQFTNPNRKQALLDRCAEAVAKFKGQP
ncbi:CehA/McbA family metallohydrolase domain-containing protein [Frigoriglobus tundricola]|uniref:Uncharacterized protein n=1 Tax=Frigoriglobus tundricola TaxID=2774151 RepID=A0A6M5Z0S1_9BACT|nr:hypothetical protein [Frigoriglobus tundricola]QJW99765.1 hypothetical protein FTUN_7388 [Frigoriglobus tundricola]